MPANPPSVPASTGEARPVYCRACGGEIRDNPESLYEGIHHACRDVQLAPRAAAPSETPDLETQLRSAHHWRRFWMGEYTAMSELAAQADVAATELRAALATERATLERLRELVDGYRNMLAAKLGYTLIPEDMGVRPQSMSYVKPSEFDRMIDALMEHDEANR